MTAAASSRMRGAPLIMLGVVFSAWVGGRAMLWENPYPGAILDIEAAGLMVAASPSPRVDGFAEKRDFAVTQAGIAALPAQAFAATLSLATLEAGVRVPERLLDPTGRRASPLSPAVAAGHQLLRSAAFQMDWLPAKSQAASGNHHWPTRHRSGASPVVPPHSFPNNVDRWSLDAFAFYRAGSNSNSISQGRVPVYGASQLAANLQYRLAPASPHDPRVFVRAYRAFVPDGENEIAGGFSARPRGDLPVRAFAEVRFTDNAFGTDVRPAVYAVTEIVPTRLPLEFTLETYAGAGYVGGNAATAFVDGQATVTREIVSLEGAGGQPLRLSLGGGSWGGAQEDASRLDVGPTMRLDLNLGEVPARISLDWRERVAGDAAPTSGLAATVSTRF